MRACADSESRKNADDLTRSCGMCRRSRPRIIVMTARDLYGPLSTCAWCRLCEDAPVIFLRRRGRWHGEPDAGYMSILRVRGHVNQQRVPRPPLSSSLCSRSHALLMMMASCPRSCVCDEGAPGGRRLDTRRAFCTRSDALARIFAILPCSDHIVKVRW